MSRSFPAQVARIAYRLPIVGLRVRKLFESARGPAEYQSEAFWNSSLTGWASSYLGGTLQVDLRDAITGLLARHLAPNARSLLDLGCGGATLASCLGPKYERYCGVDISEVAIDRARENFAKNRPSSLTDLHLSVSRLQEFEISKVFDVIVFNEVLYYVALGDVAATIGRCTRMLSPGGLILISLKDHELSQLVLDVVSQKLDLVNSVIYQQQSDAPRWKTVRDAARPAFLIVGFRARTESPITT